MTSGCTGGTAVGLSVKGDYPKMKKSATIRHFAPEGSYPLEHLQFMLVIWIISM